MKKRMSAVILAVVMLLSAFAAPLVSGTTVQAKKKKAAVSGIKKLEKKLTKKKGHKFSSKFKLDDSVYKVPNTVVDENEEYYKEWKDVQDSTHAITIKLKKDKKIYFTDLITIGTNPEYEDGVNRYLVKMVLKTNGKNKVVQVSSRYAETYHDYDWDANGNKIDLGIKTFVYKTQMWNVAPAAYKYDNTSKDRDYEDRAFFLAMKAWNTYLHATNKLTVNKLGFVQFDHFATVNAPRKNEE